MSIEAEVTKTALIPLVKGEALDLFKNEDAAVMLIEKVKDVAGEMLESLGDVNFNVKAQRDKVISVAFDVTRTKTYIETFGKDIAAELKALPKLVDANRKKIRDELDDLAEKIRKPVTEWEAKKKAQEEADALADAMPRMHEEALQMNELHDLRKAEEERKRIDHENEIKRQAAEQARIEAEQKAKRDREAAEMKAKQEVEAAAKRERDAREAQEEAEREKQDAIAKAANDAKEAKERAEREKQAAIEAERSKAEEAEKERLAEAERQKQEELNRRNNIEHQRKVNKEALESLCKQCGIDKDTAMKVIRYIAMNKVKHITINY